ncbi:MAG: toast rack family protein [Coriobacteriia bacterium]
MRKSYGSVLAAVGLVVLVLASGCTRVRLEKPAPISEMRSVSRGSAQRLRARVSMGAGELVVRGGAADLLDAEFTFAPRSWRPVVEYSVSGDVGNLSVKQPSIRDASKWPFGESRNEWDVRLTDGLPLDLAVELGAGDGGLALGTLDLRRLEVNLGAGDVTIDLTGSPAHDLSADISGGIGSLTLRVPRDVGVRVTGREDGVGTYDAPGFTADGEAFVNDAYGESEVTFDITLVRGVGDVRIEMSSD